MHTEKRTLRTLPTKNSIPPTVDNFRLQSNLQQPGSPFLSKARNDEIMNWISQSESDTTDLDTASPLATNFPRENADIFNAKKSHPYQSEKTRQNSVKITNPTDYATKNTKISFNSGLKQRLRRTNKVAPSPTTENNLFLQNHVKQAHSLDGLRGKRKGSLADSISLRSRPATIPETTATKKVPHVRLEDVSTDLRTQSSSKPDTISSVSAQPTTRKPTQQKKSIFDGHKTRLFVGIGLLLIAVPLVAVLAQGLIPFSLAGVLLATSAAASGLGGLYGITTASSRINKNRVKKRRVAPLGPTPSTKTPLLETKSLQKDAPPQRLYINNNYTPAQSSHKRHSETKQSIPLAFKKNSGLSASGTVLPRRY